MHDAAASLAWVQTNGILYAADTLAQAVLPGSDDQLTGLYLFALNVTNPNK
jgi:hypothetical protein